MNAQLEHGHLFTFDRLDLNLVGMIDDCLGYRFDKILHDASSTARRAPPETRSRVYQRQLCYVRPTMESDASGRRRVAQKAAHGIARLCALAQPVEAPP